MAIPSFIHYVDLYSAFSRFLLRSAPDSSTAKESSFEGYRVECVGTIAVSMEAHSKQRGLPPRMHESGELKYGQKGQRVPPVPLIGGNCNSFIVFSLRPMVPG